MQSILKLLDTIAATPAVDINTRHRARFLRSRLGGRDPLEWLKSWGGL